MKHFDELRHTHLLCLQHLVLKDVRDAVPDHLQPAGAVGHHVTIPVHKVSCRDEQREEIRRSFITVAPNPTPLDSPCETDCWSQKFTKEVWGGTEWDKLGVTVCRFYCSVQTLIRRQFTFRVFSPLCLTNSDPSVATANLYDSTESNI